MSTFRMDDFSRTTDGLADTVLKTEFDATVITDRGSISRFWNPGAARIFGFSGEEAIGVEGNIVNPGINELVIPHRKHSWANIRKIASAPAATKAQSFKASEYKS